MATTTYTLPHIPLPHSAHITLFHNVRNASFLRSQLLAGNSTYEYAFIDASTIVSAIHALAAAHAALHNLLVNNKLRTRNVHSETVFCLSATNNITDAFRRFGIQDSTTAVLAIKFSVPRAEVTREEVETHLSGAVEGEMVEFTDANLVSVEDWGKVGKNYKLKLEKDGGAEMKVERPVEGLRKLEVDILGKMVVRAVG